MKKSALRNRREFKLNKITILFLVLAFVAAGYAILHVGYSFIGTANLAAVTSDFNIYFDNLKVKEGSVNAIEPATIDKNDNTSVSFAINLNEIDDYYEFELDIVNDGSSNAMITEIKLDGIPSNLKKYFTYTLSYNDDNSIKVYDILRGNDRKRIKILIKFNDETDLYDLFGVNPIVDKITLNLTFEINYGPASNRPSSNSLIRQLKLDENAINDSSITYSNLNESGLYKLRNENSIYYYRGNVSNNNVLFANYCWKIIRSTTNGGIKLVYNGLSNNGVCDSTNVSIGTGKFNNKKNNARYVGFMFNDSLNIDSTDVLVNNDNSNVKEIIDNWYVNNLKDYTELLDDTVWCNDRESTNGTEFAGSEIRGLNTINGNPLVIDSKISNRQIDKFTVDSSNGNGKLTYPIGLLTADEVLLAGNGINGGTTYLTGNNPFWTMTPSHFSSRTANMFVVYEDGVLDGAAVDDELDIRPSIVLKSDLKVESGEGSSTNPYVIVKGEGSQKSIIQYLKLDSSAISDGDVNFAASPSAAGLYLKEETRYNEQPIYYYRGNVLNNNIIFANKCWKIVRTTEFGGTKLIYNGLPNSGTCNNTGDNSQISYNTFNNTKNNAIYVGYMYNSSLGISSVDPSINTTNSAIKVTLDEWFKNNLNDYVDKLEDAVWCNDRSSSGGIEFAASESRDLLGNPTPEIRDSMCSRPIDSFTKNTDNGNGKLTYPIGLLTADEAIVAGNSIGGGTTYLTSGSAYWTMTPLKFASRSSNIFVIYEDGVLDGGTVNDELGVRPSIVLKSGTEISSGDGTSSSPYVVK